ncbi:MAG: hypothetical protein BAJALOKI3v1_280029 [Promethearchaeota archaeon]|nr:MAG: hypothetical protein BAJALOKI3v1_280029 [Candidatus Lokiarchaeota archaeon]
MRDYRHNPYRRSSWTFNNKTLEECLEKNEYLKNIRKKLMNKKFNK